LGQAKCETQSLVSYDLQSCDAFSRGFVLGQTTAYIEQVSTGAKLAAQVGCSEDYVQDVLSTVNDQKCEAIVENREYGRVAIWIFRHPFVRTLIEQMSKDTPPTAAGVWAMGKLFGYSDSEIGVYLQLHGLLKSTFDSESNPRLCSDRRD